MKYSPLPISKVVAETPKLDHGDTTENPSPAPSDSKTSVNAQDAIAPATTAAQEIPAKGGSTTSSTAPAGCIACSIIPPSILNLMTGKCWNVAKVPPANSPTCQRCAFTSAGFARDPRCSNPTTDSVTVEAGVGASAAKNPPRWWRRGLSALSVFSLPEISNSRQRRKPIIHVLAGLVLCVAIALLQSTFELVALPIDVSQVIVRQLGPLLFDLALDLFPIPFHLVPIHHTSSGF